MKKESEREWVWTKGYVPESTKKDKDVSPGQYLWALLAYTYIDIRDLVFARAH